MARERDDDLLSAIVDRVLESPEARGVFERIHGVIDRVGEIIEPSARSQQPPRSSSSSPPRPQTPHEQQQVARRVLNFSPDEPLDREKIVRRRRELARSKHPDRGGSNEAMQAVNRAADILLKSLPR